MESKMLSKTEFLKARGFVPNNPQNCWCYLNEDKKEVVFSMWADLIKKHTAVIQSDNWKSKKGHKLSGEKDMLEKIHLVENDGCKAKVIIQYAKDKHSHRRTIRSYKRDLMNICLCQKYLSGKGDMFLIYPLYKNFDKPLPEFLFSEGFRLWVIPFDLESDKLLVPEQFLFLTENKNMELITA
jgi:hypothetical protein